MKPDVLLTQLKKPSLLVRMAFLVSLSGESNAQPAGHFVRFDKDRLTTGEMLSAIEQQTRYIFTFDPSTFNTARMIDLSRREYTLEQSLTELVQLPGCSYSIRGNYILIHATAPSAEESGTAATVEETIAVSIPQTIPGKHPVAIIQAPVAPTVPDGTRTSPPVAKALSEQSGRLGYLLPEIPPRLSDPIPYLSFKTNLLYLAGALAPNVSIEKRLTDRTSVQVSGSFRKWKHVGTLADNRKLSHWTLMGQYRYWPDRFGRGHFFAADALFLRYNVSGYNVLNVFDKRYRYYGNGYGVGLTYGYSIPLARRWNAEFYVGAGTVFMHYERYDCRLCSTDPNRENKFYFGLTRAGVSLSFLLNKPN